MKIVHLATTDIRGGANRGSFWLHQALCGLGVDSVMLVGRKYSDDDRVLQLGGSLAPLQEWARGKLDELPLRFYDKTDESYWTVGWVPRNLRHTIGDLAPDVVHCHWTGSGFMPVGAMANLNRPLVWTLRDMWAFTGGCHYTAGCDRYRTGCGLCPQLRSEQENDLSRFGWQRKYQNLGDGLDLTLVPISSWLARCAERSPIFSNVPATVIPNGVDTQCFRPIPKAKARQMWGLDPKKRYIMYGALEALQDERKGFKQLAEATNIMAAACWSKRAELVVFGDLASDTTPPLGLKTHFVGRITDDERLAHLYAAADVMVVPSLQEAFGKTVIEAMACGVPVVAFDHGGPADIIQHRETGYLAQAFDPADLAHGITWCLERDGRCEALGRKARARVDAEYDLNVIAIHYLDLYRSIVGGSA